MNILRQPYRCRLTKPALILLALLIGLGTMIPQAAAFFGCSHPCCVAPTGSHMDHEAIRIESASDVSCCTQNSADACHLCAIDKLPGFEPAVLPGSPHSSPQETSEPASERVNVADAAKPFASGPGAAAVEPNFPPLYIVTLSLLI